MTLLPGRQPRRRDRYPGFAGLLGISLCFSILTSACTAPGLVLRGHSFGSVRCVAFSHDGDSLASAGDDGRVIVWEAASGRRLHTLLPNRGAASWRGGQLVVAYDNGASEPLHSRKRLAVRWVGYARGRGTLIAVSREIVAYDASSGREIQRTAPGGAVPDWTYAGPILSPDGRYLATLWRRADATDKLILYVHETASLVVRLRCDVSELLPRSLAFDADGRRLTAGGQRRVLLWELDSGGIPLDIRLGNDTVRSVAFTQEPVRLVAVDDAWCVSVVDADSGAGIWTKRLTDVPRATEAGRVFFADLCVDRQEERMAIGCGWSIAVLDAHSGRRLRTLPARQEDRTRRVAPVRLVGFTGKDGLVMAGGSRVQLWSVESGRLRWESPAIEEGITAAALSPDGLRVATGGGWAKKKPTVRLFELPDDVPTRATFP